MITPYLLNIFLNLFHSPTELEIEKLINSEEVFNDNRNWFPLGNNDNNFGVIENQQSNPIAALIEKVTNSIDAILMRRCIENGINTKGKSAPKSMDEAVKIFFPDYKQWDDNGEGQHPEKFEDTFLSLLVGNKNEIHFVQGKYNMGGSGGIVFCGKRRFQLIASKRFDNTGNFGFTLVREHPLSKQEEVTKKNTWYEYLKINGAIPSFPINELDLKLHNRIFKTGTIIKLYSYQFPAGYYGFAQDLNQSINEFLFEPALPILTVDKKERYPLNKVLELDLFGLKRRLEKAENEYVEVNDCFSEEYKDELFGEMKVSCYVFKSKIKDNDVKKSKEIIRDRFFKNNMSVLFSINGQVHGHYTNEFITRTLKLSLLKNHLLIHVDCTKMNYNFRKELFMASRDRLKDGDETRILRKYLGDKLGSAGGRLLEIEKRRKDSIAVDSGDTQELLRAFTKNLPLNSELIKLLNQTFKLEQKKDKLKRSKDIKKYHKSAFKLTIKNDGVHEVAKIPLGGEKTLQFSTDVENQYFDRTEEPGDLKIALLNFRNNVAAGGDRPGEIKEVEDVFNIIKSSPKDGIIKVAFNPKKNCKVGDAIQLKVTLNGAGEDFEEIFLVKIAEPDQPKQDSKKEDKVDEESIGLPPFYLVMLMKAWSGKP